MEFPPADYSQQVDQITRRTANKLSVDLQGLSNSLTYKELLTTYASTKDTVIDPDESLPVAARQARAVFDDPVAAAVDVSREVLRNAKSDSMRVDLGMQHIGMFAPPTSKRTEIMRDSTSEWRRAATKHAGELLQIRLGVQETYRTLRRVEVPPPSVQRNDDASGSKQRLERLAEDLKKKADQIIEIIMVDRKKAAQ